MSLERALERARVLGAYALAVRLHLLRLLVADALEEVERLAEAFVAHERLSRSTHLLELRGPSRGRAGEGALERLARRFERVAVAVAHLRLERVASRAEIREARVPLRLERLARARLLVAQRVQLAYHRVDGVEVRRAERRE